MVDLDLLALVALSMCMCGTSTSVLIHSGQGAFRFPWGRRNLLSRLRPALLTVFRTTPPILRRCWTIVTFYGNDLNSAAIIRSLTGFQSKRHSLLISTIMLGEGQLPSSNRPPFRSEPVFRQMVHGFHLHLTSNKARKPNLNRRNTQDTCANLTSSCMVQT